MARPPSAGTTSRIHGSVRPCTIVASRCTAELTSRSSSLENSMYTAQSPSGTAPSGASLGNRGNRDADHRVARHDAGEPRLVPAVRALRPHRQHEVAHVG